MADYTPGTGCKDDSLNKEMDILLAELLGKPEFVTGKQFPASINVHHVTDQLAVVRNARCGT